jgi:2-keto-4-pentenoate hydratase/2-oxohepta-3-ene-1,7-dioic acid hydratase in catechol pathway
MRLANVGGRLSLLVADGLALDVERASGGLFSHQPQQIFDCWDEFVAWAETAPTTGATAFDDAELGPPVPWPRQIFAAGLNYQAHADEAGAGGAERGERPPVFTKFVTSLAGPYGEIELPSDRVDWEIELVVAIARHAHRIDAADGWSVVAGVTAGLDLSERAVQHEGPAPQYSLGKSYPGFGPIGPALVTVDELPDPDDLELGCLVNGEQVQRDTTASLLFSVPELVARLSAITPLLPGDLIFTGTPSGVGERRDPPQYLAPGDEIVGYVTGVGEIRSRLVARDAAPAVVD